MAQADPKAELSRRDRIGQAAVNAVAEGVIRGAMLLPHDRRVRTMGWVTSRLVAPLAGWRGRIRDNLARVWPELPPEEVARLVRAVPDNAGRSLLETYCERDLRRRTDRIAIEGPGLPALEEALAAHAPLICVSGHFGNHNIFRIWMTERQRKIGALYRPLNNVYFNEHYVAAMKSIAEPLFPRTRRGLAEMVKFLREGNVIAMLHDQHFAHGAPLRFFGHTAQTALSPSELAVKYGAALIPIYNIREPDGLSFRIVVDAPVPHTTPEEMSQALNDSLERMVRAHPEQWLWIHRRWKADG